MRWWSIRITCQSQWSLLSLSMSSILCCPVLTLTSSFVTLSFQEMPKMLLCHLWWAAFSLFLALTNTIPVTNNVLYGERDLIRYDYEGFTNLGLYSRKGVRAISVVCPFVNRAPGLYSTGLLQLSKYTCVIWSMADFVTYLLFRLNVHNVSGDVT